MINTTTNRIEKIESQKINENGLNNSRSSASSAYK